MPILKRPCANCPFRNDSAAIELRPGRLTSIVDGLCRDDQQTFVCHKTLDSERMTCAGAVAFMFKDGHLPVIARMGLSLGVISMDDIKASAAMVVEPESLESCHGR